MKTPAEIIGTIFIYSVVIVARLVVLNFGWNAFLVPLFPFLPELTIVQTFWMALFVNLLIK